MWVMLHNVLQQNFARQMQIGVCPALTHQFCVPKARANLLYKPGLLAETERLDSSICNLTPNCKIASWSLEA